MHNQELITGERLIGIIIILLLVLAVVIVGNYTKRNLNENNMINFGQEFKINKGERVTIGSEFTFEFSYHSHKTVYPGQNSPLIIGLAVINAQGEKKEVSTNLFPEQTKNWAWDKYQFELRDYEYDKYMVLVVRKGSEK